jgi:hypothetical protein
MLVCWYTGILVYWCTSMLVCWYAGILVYWCTGVQVCWYAGMLVCWYTGILVYWCTGFSSVKGETDLFCLTTNIFMGNLKYLNKNMSRIPRMQPTRRYVSQFIYFNKTLYMFQAVPLPIIRSSNCTYSFWYLSNLAATCCSNDDSSR